MGVSGPKPWAGRFSKPTSAILDEFGASIPFDSRLYEEDIKGSIAYARMLGKCGIIAPSEADEIERGLREVLEDIREGRASFAIELEDIHTNVESLLETKIGPVARKLHTGRSRNDQVALDIRLYVKREISELQEKVARLIEALLGLASRNLDCIMPGYTHLQQAQPVLFAHHLLAYVEMLERDLSRLRDCRRRADVLPLGSAALAGTTFPVDREFLRQELGFSAVSRNSMDAVSDRDFLIELLGACAIIMMHASRLSEELILWSSAEFGFVEIDDAYATGSSIMPQKKNPDVPELVRGKAGRVYGHLMGLLTVMKGLPLAYNKDMQEDKEALFDAVDTVRASLEVLTPLISTLKVKKERMEAALSFGMSVATDIADYLVRKGAAFRDAHRIVGLVVASCMAGGKGFGDLSLEEWRGFSPLFDEDIYNAVSVRASVEARKVFGGTAPDNVKSAIEAAGKRLLNREWEKPS